MSVSINRVIIILIVFNSYYGSPIWLSLSEFYYNSKGFYCHSMENIILILKNFIIIL